MSNSSTSSAPPSPSPPEASSVPVADGRPDDMDGTRLQQSDPAPQSSQRGAASASASDAATPATD
ncbi:MAG: hypothetical protein AAFP90_17980, partial [Planctomycetota bacterium]